MSTGGISKAKDVAGVLMPALGALNISKRELLDKPEAEAEAAAESAAESEETAATATAEAEEERLKRLRLLQLGSSNVTEAATGRSTLLGQ